MVQVSVAGASGNLGSRIVASLQARGASVVAIVRTGKTSSTTFSPTVKVVEADYASVSSLREAVRGSQVVVSALQGLRPVIVETQSRLLEAAVEESVPRFIPSDYAIDFTTFGPGRNRNLELRREFWQQIDEQPNIRATSILPGAFAFTLTMPWFVDVAQAKVLYWGDDADVAIDYSSLDNVADYTALAALDDDAPRYLRVASTTQTPTTLAVALSRLTGRQFTTKREGSLDEIRGKIATLLQQDPSPCDNLRPYWQALQFAENISSGFGGAKTHDNDRYGSQVKWATIEEVLAPFKSAFIACAS